MGAETIRSTATVPEVQAFEEMLEEFEQPELLDDLAALVKTSFEDSKRHRISCGADEDIMRSMRAVNLQYDPEDLALLENPNEIYVGITNLKVRALKSWIGDILANAEDKPWTLRPTPLPELPPEAEEAVVDALEREIALYGYTFDVRERAKYFKDVAMKHADKLAKEATSRIERKIEDYMYEGDWRGTFMSFVSDFSTFPIAVLKGPVVERTASLRWTEGQLKAVDRMRWMLKRVHPLDLYPSPNSTTPQDGTYLIERQRKTQSDLLACVDLPGFSETPIRSVILDYPNGYAEQANTDHERDELEQTDHDNQTSCASADNSFEVLVYYGKVPADLLIAHGVHLDDPQEHHEAEVWVCAGQVIKAALNPHPLGVRPFYTAAFEHVPGSFWGRGLPQLLRDTQRMCNASARALARNMAYSSAPIGEYDVNRMANETNIDQLVPYRMYAVENDSLVPNPHPAIRFQKIDSCAPDLLAVYNHFSAVADEVSAIPRYVLGNPQVSGAGRTLGGLSMLMGNAAKGVKMSIAIIDRQVIEPIITAYYNLIMMFDPDPTLKADAAVIARGSSGILQRELSQARATEVLQMLTPYAQAGIVPLPGLVRVLRDVIRGLGYDSDEVLPDPDREALIQQFLAQGGAVTPRDPQTSLAPGTPGPLLDGRSLPPPNPGDGENLPAV